MRLIKAFTSFHFLASPTLGILLHCSSSTPLTLASSLQHLNLSLSYLRNTHTHNNPNTPTNTHTHLALPLVLSFTSQPNWLGKCSIPLCLPLHFLFNLAPTLFTVASLSTFTRSPLQTSFLCTQPIAWDTLPFTIFFSSYLFRSHGLRKASLHLLIIKPLITG